MSSKFSRPTYWVGLSMVSLPVTSLVAVSTFVLGWKIFGIVIGTAVAASLVLVLFYKGIDLMMDAEYNEYDN